MKASVEVVVEEIRAVVAMEMVGDGVAMIPRPRSLHFGPTRQPTEAHYS